jgi:hypothetical protein
MASADQVVRRFLSFKFEHKETKQHKVEKLRDAIREQTGVSKGQAEDIADAILRKRDLAALGRQKSWPVNDEGQVEGPKGTFDPKTVE